MGPCFVALRLVMQYNSLLVTLQKIESPRASARRALRVDDLGHDGKEHAYCFMFQTPIAGVLPGQLPCATQSTFGSIMREHPARSDSITHHSGQKAGNSCQSNRQNFGHLIMVRRKRDYQEATPSPVLTPPCPCCPEVVPWCVLRALSPTYGI